MFISLQTFILYILVCLCVWTLFMFRNYEKSSKPEFKLINFILYGSPSNFYICLSVYRFVLMSVCWSICLSLCLSVYLFVLMSVCLSIYPYVCLSIGLSLCLSVCSSVCLSIYSIYVSKNKYLTLLSINSFYFRRSKCLQKYRKF